MTAWTTIAIGLVQWQLNRDRAINASSKSNSDENAKRSEKYGIIDELV